MRRTWIVAYLAGAAAALGLLRSVSGPIPAVEGEPRKIKPAVLAAAFVVVLAVAGVVLYLMFSGPHMRVQPKLRPYEALLPAAPAGTVPVWAVGAQHLPTARNPLDNTERTHRIGHAYYNNYCAFCHGKAGHGDGPVGQSYVPTPTDLTTPAVQGLSDAALYRALFAGVGHAPVLGYVIDPNAPWYIVAYVRSLPPLEH
jgi:hypothetical protein